MKYFVFCFFLLLCFTSYADIFTTDFESGDLRGWKRKTGDAFNYQPTKGDNPTARNRGQISNHQGDWWIGTFEKYQGRASERPGSTQGDYPTGTLTSADFIIQGQTINFLIGGGNNPINKSSGPTAVVLIVNGEMVRDATGQNSETMRRVVWNVSDLIGKTARIKILDKNSGGWGHINVDDFNQIGADNNRIPFVSNEAQQQMPKQQKSNNGTIRLESYDENSISF